MPADELDAEAFPRRAGAAVAGDAPPRPTCSKTGPRPADRERCAEPIERVTVGATRIEILLSEFRRRRGPADIPNLSGFDNWMRRPLPSSGIPLACYRTRTSPASS